MADLFIHSLILVLSVLIFAIAIINSKKSFSKYIFLFAIIIIVLYTIQMKVAKETSIIAAILFRVFKFESVLPKYNRKLDRAGHDFTLYPNKMKHYIKLYQ